ncbi:hypothetical protein BJY16_006106 [Actinoplanes octamycinicus]|uniref:Secreted protein n=1 Tax=Actinoplanes octamycinicus TaxID=135948 RepID=A0A7W7H2E8_9ACTN|nr:hypothetical protein [Actinoplanes octamycinicus]MBB4742647.1 hypothetical protein [Actinoplanes octamycinicus]GIE60985.1 hypothetical protein Aoc01nite_63870 [Actinoplanes octamycinicus]
MRIRPALAGVMTIAATATALAVADPAAALNQKTCKVKADGRDLDCITQTLDLAGSNLFHIATTGAAGYNWRLVVTDVQNRVVVVNERFTGNASVWRTNVYSDYTAYLRCDTVCPNVTLYFANG